jgi:DNA-binding phage protein
MEMVIKQASWDSMQEGRADILQAAIRSYVEQFGHSVVIERAGIKSRTSAYRSLKPETTPSFGTLVQLGHAVIELAKDRVSAHSLSRM